MIAYVSVSKCSVSLVKKPWASRWVVYAHVTTPPTAPSTSEIKMSSAPTTVNTMRPTGGP